MGLNKKEQKNIPKQNSNSTINIPSLPPDMLTLIAGFLTKPRDLINLSKTNHFFSEKLKHRVERAKRLHTIQIKATSKGWFLCLGGNLYACGKNDVKQLGIDGNSDRTTLKRATVSRVTQFAATHQKLMCLTKEGLHVVGNLREDEEKLNSSLRNWLPDGQTIKRIYLNRNRIIFLTNQKGRFYACGKNQWGELGLNVNNNKIPTPYDFPSDDTKLIDVVMSIGSTYCLTENGTVYAWGRNTNKELGLGDRHNRKYPTQVPLPSNRRTVHLEVQRESVYAVMDDGSVYVWGQNNVGQLGIRDAKNVGTPQRITTLPSNKKCHQLLGNLGGALCLMTDGSLYAWGTNGFGQLGLGQTKQSTILTPQQVSLENKKIAQIVTKNGSVFAITQDGELYSWGCNFYGQLGQENYKPQFTPKRILLPDDVRVLKLVLNPLGESIYCLTTQGLLYAWGNNSYGQLGLDHMENQSIPQPVDFPELAQWLKGEELSAQRKNPHINHFLRFS